MNYGEIKNCDIANGTGVRVSLFVSGCTHHCRGCFNPMTWDFGYGQPYTKETEDTIINMLRPGYISGLSLLGGEPLDPHNRPELIPLLQRIRTELPQKDIWCYTGYTFENDVLTNMTNILPYIDVLVDGEFILEKKNISLRFRGSENQRIIDVRQSLKENRTILWKE